MEKISKKLLVIFLKILLMAISSNGDQCPLGFDIIYIYHTKPFCIQIKSDETFFDKYNKCNGNLQPIDFFKHDNITDFIKSKRLHYYWIDYVRAYENGPFFNWLIGDRLMGIPISGDVKWSNSIIGGEMCTVYDPFMKTIRAVHCEDRYNRLCMVATYEEAEPISWDCPTSYLPFYTPIPACIHVPHGNGTMRRALIRATWMQSNEICKKNDGHLIHRGYVYANHQELDQFVQGHDLPLGIHRENNKFLWTDYSMGEDKLVSESEMNFLSDQNFMENKTYVSLSGWKWEPREANYIYNYAMCEYFVKTSTIGFVLTERNESLQVFALTSSSSDPKIVCFTDSDTHFPMRVNLWADSKDKFVYKIDVRSDGYYWCLVTNMNEYSMNTSERFLYVRDKHSLEKLYSVLIYTKNLTAILENGSYVVKNELNSLLTNSSILNLHNNTNIITSIKIKQQLSDGHVLLHIGFLNILDNIIDSIPFKLFTIKYIRNVLYCPPPLAHVGIRNYTFGDSLPTYECSTHVCTGDFNVGAYWIERIENDCIIENTHYPNVTEVITTTLEPNIQITELANSLQTLANSTVNSTQLTAVTSQINSILDFGQDVEIPKSVLQDLDSIINRVEFKENETQLKIIETNIAIAVAERGGPTPVAGLKVTTMVDGFNSDSLQILTEDEMNSTTSNFGESEIVVNISPKIGDAQSRLSFVIFKNDNAFNQNTTREIQRVNSRVLSISLGNTTTFEHGQYIDIYLKPYENYLNGNESKACAYWNFSAGANGDWSTAGCKLLPKRSIHDLDVCRCNHLTHFAEIIRLTNDDLGDINTFALTVISYVGCILSLLGLFVIGLTGAMFRSWRSDFNNKIWLHLSASTAILMVSFLLIALVDFTTYTGTCVFAGVALHYSVLSSFCWMLISAVLSYKRLVTVFSKNTSHRLLKACLFGWLTPICPIVLLFIIDSDNYVQHFNVGKISKSFCYPSNLGFWLTLFLPVALIVIANAILFFVIIYSVFMSRKIQRHGDSKQLFRSLTVSFLLFFLFGLTWGFALLSEHIIMTYLFCITATLQGLVLFIFFIVGNKKTRDLWCMCLHLKEKGKVPVTSTMSRSTSKIKTTSSKTIPLQNVSYKSTKPRSMSGNVESSDSRFS